MQLYSTPISPYSARCRIQIYHKRLPVEVIAPPGGMRSADVLAANPTGRIPVLMTPQGPLGESWAIMEYLEDRYPEPPMRPTDALANARQTELVRFADQYLAPAMFPLFRALRGDVDTATITQAVRDQNAQTAILDALLARSATDDVTLSLADAALTPIVWYGRTLGAHFDGPADFSDWPAVQSWWTRVQAVPAVQTVTGELEAGLRAAIPALFD